MSNVAPYVCTDMKIEGEDVSPQNSGNKKRNLTAVWMSHLWSALYHSVANYYDSNTVTLFKAVSQHHAFLVHTSHILVICCFCSSLLLAF